MATAVKPPIRIVLPVHHFYGPMEGAEFNIPENIALDILNDPRILVLEESLFKLTGQAWKFKILEKKESKRIDGVYIKSKDDFFDPSGENSELLKNWSKD